MSGGNQSTELAYFVAQLVDWLPGAGFRDLKGVGEAAYCCSRLLTQLNELVLFKDSDELSMSVDELAYANLVLIELSSLLKEIEGQAVMASAAVGEP